MKEKHHEEEASHIVSECHMFPVSTPLVGNNSQKNLPCAAITVLSVFLEAVGHVNCGTNKPLKISCRLCLSF